MTKDTTFQHTSSTLPLPRKHVVGVVDSLQEGEQAVQALEDAGYHAEDITFVPGQDFPSAFQERMRKDGFFGQESDTFLGMLDALATITSTSTHSITS